MKPPSRGTPDPVDLHVGERIRTRRREVGLSQQNLAELLGLTFQQVQKYEHGANRVSASKLYRIAGALEVSLAYFFEGLPAGSGEAPESRPVIQLVKPSAEESQD